MTAQQLAFIIATVISAQIGAWAAIALYRHFKDYALLIAHAVRQSAPSAPGPMPEADQDSPAWPGFREFRVARKVFEDERKGVCSFYLAPVDGAPLPAFRPGQYLTLRLDVGDPENGPTRSVLRCYSLSDRPDPNYYRISVKRVGASRDTQPGLGSNHLHDRVQEGDAVPVKAPGGHFYLTGPGTAPVCLIAGGVGITPMLSIINTLAHSNSDRQVWLFYGVGDGGEHVAKAHLEALARHHANFHLNVCYSRPREHDVEGADYHHRGRVDIRLLRLILPREVEDFYVCGPRQMMETLVPALEEWGVQPRRIHFEAFGPASVKRQESQAAAVEEPVSVTFSKSGKRLPWDPSAGSLLDFAEANGIDVDSGCRAGACGCCKTRLEAGQVEYRQTPDADVEGGTCLLCITAPKTDLTLSA